MYLSTYSRAEAAVGAGLGQDAGTQGGAGGAAHQGSRPAAAAVVHLALGAALRPAARQLQVGAGTVGHADLMMMIAAFQLRAVPRLCRLPDPEAEQLQQLRGLRVQHRRQGDGRVPEAVQEAGPRGHLETLLIHLSIIAQIRFFGVCRVDI